MSGIAGIYSLNQQPILPEELKACMETLSHRGVDRANIYLAAHVGFVHCMLQTTRESIGERLPYADHDSGNLITADARIDNREELLDELHIPYATARAMPDSLVILEAYKKWGKCCSERLIGDFAFAIWDPREQQLFCARDHMGIKPFYYFRSQSLFVFGSEIKAILQFSAVSPVLNAQRILDYLVFYNSDHSSTFYQDIHRLPARHALCVTPSSFSVTPYWDFSPEKEIQFKRDEEYADAFREHFERAVACRLRSIYPVGSFLSGGLDSSSIACVASNQLKRMGREPLITFSEIFDSLPAHVSLKADERQYMEAAIRQCGSEAHFVCFNEHGPLRNIDYGSYDEPMPYFNGYLLDETCKMAQKRGVRVLLDGTDGDTTVSHGYERLYDLGTRFSLLTLVSETREICRLNEFSFSLRNTLWKYCIRPSVPNYFKNIWKRFVRNRGRISPTSSLADFLDPDLAKSIDWVARAELLSQRKSYFRKGRLPQYWSFVSPLEQYTMEFIDTRLSGYPIEMRYPFWDRRLMEFCLALPLKQKLNGGLTRVVMRKAMRGILPQIIAERLGKADLSPQFLMDFKRTAPPFLEQLERSDSAIKKYLKAGQIAKDRKKFEKNPYGKAELAMRLYIFISLDAWLQTHG